MSSPGDKVKHYEILKHIGKGGMGEVFLAKDTILGRKVAIKFLPEEMQKNPRARSRFIREAKSAAALDHPFICKIYETGEIDGKAYIVMEYVEGTTLSNKLEEGLLPLKNSLHVASEIADALEKAHEKGIIHRDLKPSNIMLTPQRHVKVMDFGLAKRILPEKDTKTKTLRHETITEQGTIVGTLAYMSPEQARGEPVDARSDIFSLGVILNEMISGENYFSHPSAVETLTAILRDSPPPTQIKPKKVNPLINPILRKCLAKNPEKRYQSVAELATDIQRVQTEMAAATKFLLRPLPVIAATIVFLLIISIGIWKFVLQGKVSPQEIQREAISVLIADFQNKTGDSVFDGSLEPALGISLEGAPFISVYNSKKARELATQIVPSSEGRLDPQLAQLISQREGINVVVNAIIESSGDGYTIKMWALDIVTSKRISEPTQKIKTKAEVLKAADSLASELRSNLGDIPPESAEAIAKETFTTTSIEAWKAYAQAQKLDALGKEEEAIKAYLKALDNDPNFGRAYAGLAVVYYNRGEYQKAKTYYQGALERIDQMTDREKYRTRGGYYLFTQKYKKAIEEYSSLVEQFPADSAGHTNLAFAYFLGYKMSQAFEEGLRAVQLDPENLDYRFNLSWYALASGDFERAEQETRKTLEIKSSYEKTYVVLALAELAQERPAEASETYRQLGTLSSYGASLATTGLADLAVYEGRLEDALAILNKGIEFDLENEWPYRAADKYLILAQTHLLQGKKALAVDAADRAVTTHKREEILFSSAQIYLRAGKEDKARNLAGKLSPKVQPIHQAYAKLIGGEMSLARGDIIGAINLFQEAQALVDTWLGRFALGRAYLEAEEFTEAYSEFELCLKRQGEAMSVFLNDLPSHRYLDTIYYYLGRAQEGLNSPAATDSYQKFLKIKEKADQGVALVEDARRRLTSL